ncbi:restriction endonuclease subunit S [Pseudomonas aeruginosa]|uniref:restriction endonuclease subunit S n=1 Tax=Pseudomonas aeruginosa TaxID=287 RepID=UPI000CFE7EB8|nr:restriction endonuclease subunit S [Pseudomonas aeruginosa]EKX3431153.1 restriction endonuclease subunit S [Pseudomonas aeruginosa]MBX5576797.1 restriction endonuclease subunit S [Pseudomonas aeruginosa]MCQ9732347.1 restriction endonuclease subunit S [Pseudomonas aeruginosa]MCS8237043.1 restriction endonuclease subunit S [Pseudomonas aeruginosa]MCT0306742.1 restriction endonuclease subunit S [Pseudomonas aeruginosa]
MSWPLVKLGDVCERVSVGHVGTTSEFYTDGTGVPFLRTQNVGSDGLVLEDVKYITHEFHKVLRKSTLAANDVVMSRVVSTSVNCGIVPEYLEGANCANIILARPIKDKLVSEYLVHYLRSSDVQGRLLARQVGSAQSVVNTGVLKSWEIPLPPLPEQKRIAAILDKADSIRRKRQQAIQLADDFLRSVFLDMFGDPVTNPKGWPLKRFGEVGTWSSGGTPSRAISDFFEGEINWYSAGELNSRYLDGSVEKISESAIKNSAAKIFKKDSLLVGMYDTAAMKISILKEDSSCNQACANVECNELASVEWLYSYIDYAKDSYLSRRRGVRQKNLNLGMIRDFLLPLPPRDLQDEFVRFVSAVFGMKKKQDECKDFPVFESLSLKAFSGQL